VPRSPGLRALFLFGASLVLAAPAPAVKVPRVADDWIRLESAHFVAFSGASESKTREILLDLERFRAVLMRLKPSSPENAPVPTTLYVFPSDSALTPYKPRLEGKPRNAAAFFRATREGNAIVLAASWNTDPRHVVYHEYVHYFMHSNFPPQPTWYDEGFAEFYSTFRSSGNEAEIGLPIERHLRTLREVAMMPLSELFAVRKDSPSYNDSFRQGIFYAESWALVHYMLRTEPKLAEEFGRFLVRLQKGEPAEDAFVGELHVQPDVALRDLYTYVHQARFQYARIRFTELAVPTETTLARLKPEDALAALGDLLAHGGEDELAEAEAHFDAALARAGAHPAALAGMAYCRMRRGKYEEATRFLDRALSAGSTDFRVPYRQGEIRLRTLPRGATRAAALEEARAAFRRALDANPAFSEARAALGRTYLSDEPARAREGIPVLEAAVRELPARPDLALDLAALYERAGDPERAEELRHQALGPEGGRRR
jgi:tetratricopeptide (TPR) repeat protein